MNKYFLYGAGINCTGVIKFFGIEHLLGIIDGDKKKHGHKIEGLEVISLKQYMEEGQNAPIIITAYFQKEAIKQTLNAIGVTNYYVSTYMQTGYYEDVDDIIEKLELMSYSVIYFVTRNPMTEMLGEKLLQKNRIGKIVYMDEREDDFIVQRDDVILVVSEEEKKEISSYRAELIKDINEIYLQKYSFKNEQLKKFRNIHKGKRCFIIGNGPSLRYEDLELLHERGEICFGTNRIYYAYEHTKWRPDYYVLVDHILFEKEIETVKKLTGIKFVRHFYKTNINKGVLDLYEIGGLHYIPGKPEISFDIKEGVYIGYTVVYDALQIAVYMGFNEIYFLGVDMTSNKRPEEEGFHFYKSPDTKENLCKGNVSEAVLAIKNAGEVLKEKGIDFKNATRGGELEVLERVDFDKLF